MKKKKLEDLRTIAKMFGVKSVTTKNKAQLIEAMQQIAMSEKQDVAADVSRVEETSVAAAIEQPAQEPSVVATPEQPANESVPSDKQPAEMGDKPDEGKPKDKKNKPRNEQNKQTAKKNRNGSKQYKKKTKKTDTEDLPVTNQEASEAQEANEKTTSVESNEQTSSPEQTQIDSQIEEAVEETAPTPASSQPTGPVTYDAEGILEVLPDSYGFLRCNKYISDSKDTYVPPTLIRKFNLKTGDYIKGKSKYQRENDKYQALCYINTVNDDTIDVAMRRKPFESLIPIYPDSKIKLETVQNELSTRIIDLIAPIGKGQRGMIVSPPKAGKTVLLKKIANSITENHPDINLIVLLIDERPEEVTDMRESVQGDVISSTFDEMPEKHIKVAEMVFERAQRLVEHGKDVVILMDSLTRLARAYNITIPPTGRSLSGGLDPGALYKPKRFFGAARNIRGGGSLTIIATALIDTGSKMDDVIFEEFKGTGNMELHLDRKLSEKRVFPAIDINKSGTRKEELLLTEDELSRVYSIRKALSNAATAEVTEMIVNKMLRTKNNEEFLKTINIIGENK